MSTPSFLSAIQKIRFLISHQDKMAWLLIGTFALASSILEVFTAAIIVVFAQILNQPPLGQKYFAKIGLMADVSPSRTVFYCAIIVGVSYVVKNVFAALEVWFQNHAIQKMNHHYKQHFLSSYANMDYRTFLTKDSSYGVSIITSNIEQMFTTGLIPLAGILSEGFVFFFLVATIVYMNPIVFIYIFCASLVAGFFMSRCVFPIFYRYGQNLQEAGLNSHRMVYQFFHAFKEIILLGKKDYFVDQFHLFSKKRAKLLANQTALNAMPRFVIEVFFVGIFMTAIAVLCLEHDTPAQMMGVLAGYLYTGFRLMPSLNRVFGHFNTFKSTIPYIERVYEECQHLSAKNTYLHLPNFHFDKVIHLHNVTFQYLGAHRPSITNLSIDIQKGESIGIVGETGSGKSTLVDLILGVLKPDCGSVLIDRQFPVNSHQWHAKIGYVPQSIFLTDDTIAANIAFGEEIIDQEKLHFAIDAAQLRKLVLKLPEGVNTIVGERGIKLSGGERQRIAIARALYREPEALIFDEATAALDHATESSLMKTIHLVSKNRTVIMIAHRVTTLKNCDRIVIMEDGMMKDIVSYDTLNERMALEKGYS